MNITHFANIIGAGSASLDRHLAEKLREILDDVSWLRGWKIEVVRGSDRRWDIEASGMCPGDRQAALCIECKSPSFQPSQFSSLTDRSCPPVANAVASKVLAMPRVSPRMAALCQAHGWSWFDAAGNCRLEIPGVLLIERSGNAPLKLPRPAGANLGTQEAGRVVRALLAPENAGRRWTQRGVVDHFANSSPRIAAPSLALVNKVIQFLRNQAFLEPMQTRGFRVRDYAGLLSAWREAYRFDRLVRRRYFTLHHGAALMERLRRLDSARHGQIAYAAFSAADIQAPAVRQPRTWLFLNPILEQEFRLVVDAKPVDSGENLVVLLADDESVFYALEARNGWPACTNAVQTYVDLSRAGGRGDEAAEALLRQRLTPAWEAASQ